MLGRRDALERQLGSGGGGRSGGGGGAAVPPSGPDGAGPKRGGASRGKRSTEAAAPQTAPATVGAKPREEPDLAEAPPADATPVEPAGAPLAVVMDRLRVFAQNENRGLFASLDEAVLLERREGFVKLAVGAAFHRKRLQDREDELAETCGRFFGASTRVEIVAAAPGNGGHPRSAPDRREDERRRRQEALNHPKINVALEALQAEIVDIRPLGGK